MYHVRSFLAPQVQDRCAVNIHGLYGLVSPNYRCVDARILRKEENPFTGCWSGKDTARIMDEDERQNKTVD
jgi:hypothetical protein